VFADQAAVQRDWQTVRASYPSVNEVTGENVVAETPARRIDVHVHPDGSSDPPQSLPWHISKPEAGDAARRRQPLLTPGKGDLADLISVRLARARARAP
jgi:hypothetical protein